VFQRRGFAHALEDNTIGGLAAGLRLRVVVTVVMAAMMRMALRKDRGRKQEEQREDQKLFHNY
jgi:hypothetical protein